MIVAHMVVKNEAHRLLDSCLSWNSQWWDELHVYDDQSTDDTLSIVHQFTDKVTIRPDDVPSFSENESAFRQAAWTNMEEKLKLLHEGDWVFCIDADQFLVGAEAYMRPHTAIETMIDFALSVNRKAFTIHVPEVWDASGAEHLIRVDGFWNTNFETKLVRWQPGGEFADVKLGGGCVPTYATESASGRISVASLLHYGYTVPGETDRKFALYSDPEGNAHATEHIQSIIATPTLQPWRGVTPCLVSELQSPLSVQRTGTLGATTL